jgi:hypothetical protein
MRSRYVEQLEHRASQLEELLNKVRTFYDRRSQLCSKTPSLPHLQLCPGFDLLEDYGAAVEESSRINAEYDSEEDEVGVVFPASRTGSGIEPDFSHAIPPSLGSPSSMPSVSHARSNSATMSPIPLTTPSIQMRMDAGLSSADIVPDPSLGDEELIPSDDELNARHSLSHSLNSLAYNAVWPPGHEPQHIVQSPTAYGSTEHSQLEAPGMSSPGRHSRSSSSPAAGSTSPPPRMPPMPKISRDFKVNDRRFFGKSSTFMILKKAVEMRSEYWRASGTADSPRHSDGYSDGSSVDDPATGEPAGSLHDTAETSYSTMGVPQEPDHAMLPCGCPNYGTPHPVRFIYPLRLHLAHRLAPFLQVGSPCFSSYLRLSSSNINENAGVYLLRRSKYLHSRSASTYD